MSYADIDDVFGRYSPINTLIGSGSNQVTSVDISSVYIADAESLIDSYIGRRYEVPLSSPTSLITSIASDLAIFNMLVERLPQTPDFFQPRYDRAIKNLEMLRDGKMLIPGATEVTTGDQEAWSSTQSYHPVFNPVLDAEDQRVDKDQVDQAISDRSGDLNAPDSDDYC